MREYEVDRRQRLAYEETLYRYSTALERGDFDTIIAILHEAESDARLERLIIETHQEGYQQEEPGMIQDEQTILLLPDAPQEGPRRQPRPSIRKPRKRWLIALQGIAAALVVVTLIAGALFIFTSFHNATAGSTGAIAQTSDIVVTIDMKNLNKNAGEGTATAQDARTGKQLWSYTFGKDVDLNSKIGLVVQDHVVYIASNKQVIAFRAKDGKLLWKAALGSADQRIILGDNMPRLIVDQGRVYASGYSAGNLYTLDAKTGKVLWHYDADLPALLTESNGIAYVKDGDNSIKALDGKNGYTFWTYDVKSMSLSTIVANNVLYVQAAHSLKDNPKGMHKNEKLLMALNAATGKQLWSVTAPAYAPSDLVVAQGVVALFNGEAFCGYAASDGHKAWCTNGPTSDFSEKALASVDGMIYGLYSSQTNGQVLLAIDPRNGTQSWSVVPEQGALGVPQIIAYGDSLILPQNGVVLNRSNGEVRWHFSGDSKKHLIMVAAAGQI
ncbi:PQQ-binding-like beta-propeller repeat protein [Ktedonospora formicarum]|uniref:Pyrrolo-quinoline quinone repeat domain-containing protein n=1 Tax=Ktedonospora formicarum TaxID=2778364 RepID=A0A8J3I2D8_9CHLR|nr:PQQ-binding-like beta-propeller repeat protein [Ktedonospora formicarum]GHO44793.1 hypothetical protein KSX_29560 [Ktedonospora formicarum]